jgi:hypothetical protein
MENIHGGFRQPRTNPMGWGLLVIVGRLVCGCISSGGISRRLRFNCSWLMWAPHRLPCFSRVAATSFRA